MSHETGLGHKIVGVVHVYTLASPRYSSVGGRFTLVRSHLQWYCFLATFNEGSTD